MKDFEIEVVEKLPEIWKFYKNKIQLHKAEYDWIVEVGKVFEYEEAAKKAVVEYRKRVQEQKEMGLRVIPMLKWEVFDEFMRPFLEPYFLLSAKKAVIEEYLFKMRRINRALKQYGY